MAYQVSRKKKISEELELLNEHGEAAKTITVDIDVDRIAMEFNKRYNAVVRAQMAAKAVKADAPNPEAFENLGNAIIELYSLIFGESQTTEMLDFFEGNHIEMLTQTMPFVVDVVMPSIRMSAEEIKESAAQNYKVKQRFGR